VWVIEGGRRKSTKVDEATPRLTNLRGLGRERWVSEGVYFFKFLFPLRSLTQRYASGFGRSEVGRVQFDQKRLKRFIDSYSHSIRRRSH
jgi:hypothetical protein